MFLRAFFLTKFAIIVNCPKYVIQRFPSSICHPHAVACSACFEVQIRLCFSFFKLISQARTIFLFPNLQLWDSLLTFCNKVLFACVSRVFLTSPRETLHIFSNLPSSNLSTCKLGRMIHKSVTSLETAPTGPPILQP